MKHGVGLRQAPPVFRDPMAVSVYDEDHSLDEDRWLTIGQISGGTLLVVAHTFRQIDAENTVIRLISARRPTPLERRQYEEES